MSNYTLEQKALAFFNGELWWSLTGMSAWTNAAKDCDKKAYIDVLRGEGLEYHIGPTPPKELTGTELELVEMLERLLAFNDRTRIPGSNRYGVEAEAAAIAKKVRGEA